MYNLLKYLLLIVVATLVISCGKGNITSTNERIVPTLPGWTLVWDDEFDSTAINLSKWSYEVGGNGWGNSELEYYTSRPNNAYVDSGFLVIQALKENYLGNSYTSARLVTKNKGDWLYGRIEVRAKLPYGKGIWPAIWMMPTDSYYGGWPLSGEIDIMELLGDKPNKVYGTIHFGETNQQRQGSYTLPTGFFSDGFHLFAIEWDSTSISWFVDSSMFFRTYIDSPFDKRFYLILNVAVGGDWPGNPDYTTVFPQQMVVDYVRVYKRSG